MEKRVLRSMEEIKGAALLSSSSHWFDKGTLQYFGTQTYPYVGILPEYEGTLFISNDYKVGGEEDSGRQYRIRHAVFRKDGQLDVRTVNHEPIDGSFEDAKAALDRVLAQWPEHRE